MAKLASSVTRPRKCYTRGLEQWIYCHIMNRSTNQIAGNSLFSSEIDLFRLYCTFCFPNTDHVMILRRFDPLSFSLKREHASMNMSLHVLLLMNMTKDQISWVSSHDLYWELKQNVRVKKVYYTKMEHTRNSAWKELAILQVEEYYLLHLNLMKRILRHL